MEYFSVKPYLLSFDVCLYGFCVKLAGKKYELRTANSALLLEIKITNIFHCHRGYRNLHAPQWWPSTRFDLHGGGRKHCFHWHKGYRNLHARSQVKASEEDTTKKYLLLWAHLTLHELLHSKVLVLLFHDNVVILIVDINGGNKWYLWFSIWTIYFIVMYDFFYCHG